MDVSPDFKELLRGLNGGGVRYLVIGGYAVAYHAEPRYTKDLDLWIEPTPENAARIWRVLVEFRAPLKAVSEADFANPNIVYAIGVAPHRVDFMMGVEGVKFSAAWARRVRVKYDDVPIFVLGLNDLIRTKRAAGRPQDLLDIAKLTQPRRGNRRVRSPAVRTRRR